MIMKLFYIVSLYFFILCQEPINCAQRNAEDASQKTEEQKSMDDCAFACCQDRLRRDHLLDDTSATEKTSSKIKLFFSDKEIRLFNNFKNWLDYRRCLAACRVKNKKALKKNN